jgi:glucosamine-6-phosphate deaminase
VFAGPEAIGRALASLIADELAAAPGRPFLLGCPSGRSPRSTYLALADEVADRRLDLSGLVIVMMDDYVDHDPVTSVMRRIDPETPHSCLRFGRAEIVDRLNDAAGEGRGIGPERYWVPDPGCPERYEAVIAEHGGIDLFILATGATDGHIAFNPPGTDPGALTRVVRLAEPTRRDNLATFPTFGGELDRVPRFGVTVGVGTIRDQSKRVVMVAHGDRKAEAVRRIAGAQRYTPDWPATILAECADPQLFVDEAAARALGPRNGTARTDGTPAGAISGRAISAKETGWLA